MWRVEVLLHGWHGTFEWLEAALTDPCPGALLKGHYFWRISMESKNVVRITVWPAPWPLSRQGRAEFGAGVGSNANCWAR